MPIEGVKDEWESASDVRIQDNHTSSWSGKIFLLKS